MSALAALASGLIGSCALTAAHEATRRVVSDAPRMDVLGEREVVVEAEPFSLEHASQIFKNLAHLGREIAFADNFSRFIHRELAGNCNQLGSFDS